MFYQARKQRLLQCVCALYMDTWHVLLTLNCCSKKKIEPGSQQAYLYKKKTMNAVLIKKETRVELLTWTVHRRFASADCDKGNKTHMTQLKGENNSSSHPKHVHAVNILNLHKHSCLHAISKVSISPYLQPNRPEPNNRGFFKVNIITTLCHREMPHYQMYS